MPDLALAGFVSSQTPDGKGTHMATLVIASLVLVPLVLLVVDVARARSRQDETRQSYGARLDG
jgi:hypothetical protein